VAFQGTTKSTKDTKGEEEEKRDKRIRIGNDEISRSHSSTYFPLPSSLLLPFVLFVFFVVLPEADKED
jgi:hypothetical protein